MTRLLYLLASLAMLATPTTVTVTPACRPLPRDTRVSALADTLHVLFIGNSFTYYNDMPRIVEAISARSGQGMIQTRMVATGGASLDDNWADTTAQRALQARHWDWVVVNDQSTFNETFLVDGLSRIHGWSELDRNTSRFDSAARAIGAHLAIVLHWADQDAPARDGNALAYAITTVAHRYHATLIPVGAAWQSVRRAHPEITLYDTDRHHPSPAGSYLLASTIYATLTDHAPGPGPDTVRGPAVEKPEGTVYPDSIVVLAALTPSIVATLQHAAWISHQFVRAHDGYPPVSPPPPIALPTLPAPADHLTAADLLGTWRGEFHFYPRPATLILDIHDRPDGLHGTLRLLLGGPAGPAKVDSVSVHIGDGGTLFTMDDPSGPNHTTVHYKGRALGHTLTGIADAADSTLHVYGTWTLHHDP